MRIKWTHAVLGEAQELSLDAFVGIFHPADPDLMHTVRTWQTMAIAFLLYTTRHPALSASEKRAAFLLLLTRTSGKPLPPDLKHSPAVVLWDELGDIFDAFK